MKPTLYKLVPPANTSLYYCKYDCDYFERPWHFHKEFELVYIVKSKGTKFIGNKILDFEEGDLTLIGAYTPHLFRCNSFYYQPENAGKASAIFIHFQASFLENSFLGFPEFREIKNLIQKAALGLQIKGDTKNNIIQILYTMEQEDSSKRIINLLHILDILSKSQEVYPVLDSAFIGKNNQDATKINRVIDYVINNYTRKIYLHEVAEQLHMSTSAFSRYFKTHTLKTFSDYVTEIRINNACKLLMDKSYTIAEVGFLSGFENRANFYRHFKTTMGIVPKAYRQATKL
jgi:AraC-like DNA-binding protein